MFSLVLFALAILCEGEGLRHPAASHHHYHPQPSVDRKITRDERILHDKKHIAEDLGEWSDDAHLTNDEMEFRYFKIHDFDNNTKLDGLEIFQAIKHSMESAGPTDAESWPEKESTIIQLIDQVLFEDDTNNDGYLSYPEYVVGRQKEKEKMYQK